MSEKSHPMHSLPPEAISDIKAVLAKTRPQQVLVIDDSNNQLPALAQESTWVSWCLSDAHPPAAEKQYDLAIAMPTLFMAPQDNTTHVLSSLRDLYARTTLVFFEEGARYERWQLDHFLGLGFRHLRQYDSPAALHLLYYDIYDYKHTPDWFSPKNWANPEQWNKNRW